MFVLAVSRSRLGSISILETRIGLLESHVAALRRHFQDKSHVREAVEEDMEDGALDNPCLDVSGDVERAGSLNLLQE